MPGIKQIKFPWKILTERPWEERWVAGSDPFFFCKKNLDKTTERELICYPPLLGRILAKGVSARGWRVGSCQVFVYMCHIFVCMCDIFVYMTPSRDTDIFVSNKCTT